MSQIATSNRPDPYYQAMEKRFTELLQRLLGHEWEQSTRLAWA
jgi:hypothetical protein